MCPSRAKAFKSKGCVRRSKPQIQLSRFCISIAAEMSVQASITIIDNLLQHLDSIWWKQAQRKTHSHTSHTAARAALNGFVVLSTTQMPSLCANTFNTQECNARWKLPTARLPESTCLPAAHVEPSRNHLANCWQKTTKPSTTWDRIDNLDFTPNAFKENALEAGMQQAVRWITSLASRHKQPHRCDFCLWFCCVLRVSHGFQTPFSG